MTKIQTPIRYEPVSRPVKPVGGGWERAVKELAFTVWSWAGKQSGTATEFILLQEAIAATPEGQEPPPVPSARTINGWAREESWRSRFYRDLATGDFAAELTAAKVQVWQIGRGAGETMAKAQAGVYDHNPSLLAAKIKEAEFAVRLAGSGTYGQQFGGSVEPRIEDLLSTGDLAIEAEALTPQERGRRMREKIVADNAASG
jgi:hypothetical protein